MKSTVLWISASIIFCFASLSSQSQNYWGDVSTNNPTFTSGNVTIGGTQIPGTTKLFVTTNRQNGIIIDHTSENNFSLGLFVRVDNDLTKAFTVHQNGIDLFRVWGNGLVQATTIYAEEIQVRYNVLDLAWPDYVFDVSYSLMGLSELEQFINKEKHLPEIPSDTEIYSEGYDLKDMDALLLKKIEELTLYIIEQDKAIEDLKNKMEQTIK